MRIGFGSDGFIATSVAPLLYAPRIGTRVQRLTAQRTGRSLDTHIVVVYDVRDGKIAMATEYEAEPHKINDFWS